MTAVWILEHPKHTISLEEGKTGRIGRQPEADWTVPHRSVSRLHARISWRDGEPLIQDLDSNNGTRVDGVSADQPLRLPEGSRVEIGTVTYVVTRAAQPSSNRELLLELERTARTGRLRVQYANETRSSLWFQAGEIVVGSGSLEETLELISRIVAAPPLESTFEPCPPFAPSATPRVRPSEVLLSATTESE